jgi:hypothetical protein
MRTISRVLTGLLLILLAGCSFQAALDKMVTPERQKEIIGIAERFCTDPASTVSLLHPEIANTAVEAIPVLPRECPDGPATWQIANYSWKTNTENGQSERQEEVVVVGEAKGKWSTVSLRFYAQNDAPLQITEWNVLGSTTRPEILVLADQYEATAKTLSIVLPIALLVIGGLIFWLVRRNRAKKRNAAGIDLP